MMLGTDITLKSAGLNKDYRKAIEKSFPRVFKTLEMPYYSIASRACVYAITGKEAGNGATITVTMNNKTLLAMLKRLSKVASTEYTRVWKEVGVGSMEDGMAYIFPSSFDGISRFTDIIFAAEKIRRNGHKATITVKTY